MRTAVVVAAHDGLVSYVTGVGVMVNWFIEAFHTIRKKSTFLKDKEVELICISPYLKEGSSDFNPRIKEITSKECKSTGGRLVRIPTLSDGSSQASIWCGPTDSSCYAQWNAASLSAASHLKILRDEYDEILLFCHDTIFAAIRRYCPDIKNMRVIWIPHSLGKVFKDEFSDVERIQIEQEAIEAMENSGKDFIGYINQFFKEKLNRDYNVKKGMLIPFINGIYFNSTRYLVSPETVRMKFDEYGIPKGQRIIFSWGRCVYQKGYDLLIPAYKKFLEDNKGFHLMLLMPVETSTNEYLDRIAYQLSDLPKESFTAISKFDYLLPKCVLSHEDLEMVIFPSRFEGAPITALEALAFTGGRTKIMYSEIPSFLEVLKYNPRALAVREISSPGLFKAMSRAAMKETSNISASEKHDFVKNYVKGLDMFGRLKDGE